MKRRLIFIVQQLNRVDTAELSAVSMASELAEEFDVFLFSIEEIDNKKIHPSFQVHPRVGVRSFSLPHNQEELQKALIKEGEAIRDKFADAIRGDDVFFLYSKLIIPYLPKIGRKVWMTGFEKIDDYSYFDAVSFLSYDEYRNECMMHPNLQEHFFYVPPFSRFEGIDDYKFHGNRILLISSLEKERNPFMAIDIAKRLKENNLIFLMTICGEGSLEDELNDRIDELDLENCVEIVPFDELHRYFKEADLFLYLSGDMFYPLMLLEAITSSVPVVSMSSNPYIQSILDKEGIYVEDEEEAISAILSLLSDKIRLSKKKFLAFLSSKRFSKKKHDEAVHALLDSMVVENEML